VFKGYLYFFLLLFQLNTVNQINSLRTPLHETRWYQSKTGT
jgi:hypothetical protein